MRRLRRKIMPKIKYLNHSAKVVTDEAWGSTLESNLQSIARAAGVCYHNDIPVTEKLITMAIKHPALLEHTNFEIPSIYNDPEGVTNIRDWRKWTGKNHDRNGQILNGSWRDLLETGKTIEEVMRYYTDKPMIISKNHLGKRIQLMIVTNADVGHKLRTERSLSQLATSPSDAKIDWMEEFPIVTHDPEFLRQHEDKIQSMLKIWQEFHVAGIYDLDIFRGDYKSFAKQLMPDFRVSYRVMTGTVGDILNMCEKRLKQSKKRKKDLLACVNAIRKAVSDYVS
jgi:hypothetical protein